MTHKTRKTNSYDAFLDIYLQELAEAPDSEILDGVDPDAEKALGSKLLKAASEEAGGRRLARARVALSKEPRSEFTQELGVSADEARRFIQTAMNDSRMTLAARKLEELSDEDVLRMYSQIKELQAIDNDDSPAKQ